jgi:hypothetical protein
MTGETQLNKYNKYDRKAIHDIFSPHTTFQPSRGTWGLQGIVKVPNRLKDYVFMVTFEQSPVQYNFDESVTNTGILTWQSQPQQHLEERRILNFINHDHEKDNIYLFLRTNKKSLYTYLGKLAYLSHNPKSEKPVHFKWQILDWNIGNEVLADIGLQLISSNSVESPSNLLVISNPPYATNTNSKIEHSFVGRKIDFAENEKNNRELGFAGEELVINMEREHLIQNDRHDLAEKVIHTSQIIGDGTGFDIMSFDLEGTKKFIEVKTTKGGAGTPFYISSSEYQFAHNKDNYFLYRLYNFDQNRKYADYFILKSDELSQLYKEPISYKVFPRKVRGDSYEG